MNKLQTKQATTTLTNGIQNQESKSYDYMVKILVLGDSAVGKTSIMCKFCDKNFKSSHVVTIGVDFKYKLLECNGRKIKLQIWDTAGQEKFRSIVQTLYKGAMGIVLTYSVTDRRSFQNIESWIKQIHKNTSSDIAMILVGNKADSLDRVIDFSEGKRIADNYGIKFFETSAKLDIGLNEAFLELAQIIDNKVGENIPPEPTPQPGGIVHIKPTPEFTIPPKKDGCGC